MLKPAGWSDGFERGDGFLGEREKRIAGGTRQTVHVTDVRTRGGEQMTGIVWEKVQQRKNSGISSQDKGLLR